MNQDDAIAIMAAIIYADPSRTETGISYQEAVAEAIRLHKEVETQQRVRSQTEQRPNR